MQLLAASAGEIADYALAVFLLASGLGLAYALVRLGGTFARLSSFIRGTEVELLPVIHKVGESVDKVNGQLDKVDQVTDSAVDMAESADTAVRAVSMAITRPVQKISGFAAGLTHGVATLKTRRECRRGGPEREGSSRTARARPRRGASRRRQWHDLMETQVLDTVEITIPRERDFSIVAELVVGGIAARRDVTLEVLDDLQLALGSLLEHDEADDGEVTVLLRVGDDTIEVSVGPVGEHTAAVLDDDAGETLGLRRLLDTTVDDATVSRRDGGAWVELRKTFVPAEPQS